MRRQDEASMNENEPNEGAELVHRVAREWLDETEVVPLSILALDLEPPVGGWKAMLEARGIGVIEDDLYRASITREDARRLAQERREREARLAEEAARRATQRTAPVAVGVPAIDGSPVEALMNAPGYVSVREEFGRGGQSVFEELLIERLAEGRRPRRKETK